VHFPVIARRAGWFYVFFKPHSLLSDGLVHPDVVVDRRRVTAEDLVAGLFFGRPINLRY